MTPAEHYAEAERVLSEIKRYVNEDSTPDDRAWQSVKFQIAQVHATLAQTHPAPPGSTPEEAVPALAELRVLADRTAERVARLTEALIPPGGGRSE